MEFMNLVFTCMPTGTITGSVITDEDSKPEILSRVGQTTAALTRLKPVWNNSISLSSNMWLICSLITSIFLYDGESWTLTTELQRRVQAMEMRCYRCYTSQTKTMLPTGSPCPDPASNWTTRRPPDHHKEKQTTVVWSCLPFIRSGQHHLASTVKGGRRRGRQKKRWEDNVREARPGQAWSLPSPVGQLRTWSRLWSPNDPCGWGIGEGRRGNNRFRSLLVRVSCVIHVMSVEYFWVLFVC